mmetsp:Transcript_33462/g.61846  ORF Transcript_33462/g.61846 Transcript_33462/m.61846 type:complete len:317 (+) Transcript_33462:67-1017(+)
MGRGGKKGGKGGRGRRLSPEEDAARYLAGYPELVDDPEAWDNVRFHMGEIKSRSMDAKWPEDTVDNIHSKWWGDYGMLERHHSWVQWLFPIREQGVNRDSQPLTVAEREEILKDSTCLERLHVSYELAMDFYGFSVERTTGHLQRTASFQERFANLNSKSHNFLRLTRILKWLGEFNLAHYQSPLICALARAVYEPPQHVWEMRKSLRDYFVPVVKDAAERACLVEAVLRMDDAAMAAWEGDSRQQAALQLLLQSLEGREASVPVEPTAAAAPVAASEEQAKSDEKPKDESKYVHEAASSGGPKRFRGKGKGAGGK